jgi:hypothetical protein
MPAGKGWGRALAAAAFTAALLTGPAAHADSPLACYNDTSFPRTYTHGDPATGLVYRHSYYYLDVSFGPGCGLGADGLVHLKATVTVTGDLAAIGAVPGTPPSGIEEDYYWLEFHGYASSGAQYTLENDPAVTTTTPTETCVPNSTPVQCSVNNASDNWTAVFYYDGPDVFGLSTGSDARFRIADESCPAAEPSCPAGRATVITDFATLTVEPGPGM